MAKPQIMTYRLGAPDGSRMFFPSSHVPLAVDAFAVAIVFAGENGALLIPDPATSNKPAQSGIPTQLNGNFVIRNAPRFMNVGLHVLMVDVAPAHLTGISDDDRAGGTHASEVAAIIADARTQWPGLKIWLVGTSKGTISVASCAANFPSNSNGPDGIVLTSSVTAQTKPAPPTPAKTVLDIPLENIRARCLLISHESDSCVTSPPANNSIILGRLDSATVPAWQRLTGGFFAAANPCQAFAHHGFNGSADDLVGKMTTYMRAQFP